MTIAVRGRISELSPEERDVLLVREPEEAEGVPETVADMIAAVRRDGDAELLRMVEKFDGVSLDAVEVPQSTWIEALAELDPALRSALRTAVENVRTFHAAQVPEDLVVGVQEGLTLRWRAVPLERAGVYAPGGRASYPSSVIMGVVPAKAAGVQEVVVCSPAGPDGLPPKAVLAAAEMSGASRVFAVGGAGAIAAMAYGTESVPVCDVIVGPGNRWVTEAKRQVAGTVQIDSPAGPSEVLVIADDTASVDAVVGELIAQAEHDPEAAVALVTWSEELLQAVGAALPKAVAAAPRRAVVEEALVARGGLLLAADRDEAIRFAQIYAAEHLAVYTEDPERDAEPITSAGTIFLGQPASVVFGDYITGANHVLPTGGRGRAFSGLSTRNFLRVQTLQSLTPEAAAALGPKVEVMATAEGLPGHAAAARMRGSS